MVLLRYWVRERLLIFLGRPPPLSILGNNKYLRCHGVVWAFEPFPCTPGEHIEPTINKVEPVGIICPVANFFFGFISFGWLLSFLKSGVDIHLCLRRAAAAALLLLRHPGYGRRRIDQ